MHNEFVMVVCGWVMWIHSTNRVTRFVDFVRQLCCVWQGHVDIVREYGDVTVIMGSVKSMWETGGETARQLSHEFDS
jgi:hypothetical protein